MISGFVEKYNFIIALDIKMLFLDIRSTTRRQYNGYNFLCKNIGRCVPLLTREDEGIITVAPGRIRSRFFNRRLPIMAIFLLDRPSIPIERPIYSPMKLSNSRWNPFRPCAIYSCFSSVKITHKSRFSVTNTRQIYIGRRSHKSQL